MLLVRCTDDSFQKKMRRGVKSKNGGNKTDDGYLFTHFCFDFEQVNFKALLYLTCLFLGCCFFSTEIGDLFRRHTGIRPPLLSPEAMVSETLGLVNLPHVPRALNRFLIDFTPLPPVWDARLYSASQGLAHRVENSSMQHIFML